MMIDKPQLEPSHLGLFSIDIHYENNTISVGDYVFDKPLFFAKNSHSKRIYSDTLIEIIEANKKVLNECDKSTFESIKKDKCLLSTLDHQIDIQAENHFFSKYVGENFYMRMRKAMFLLWLHPSDIKTAISACAFNHVIGQTLNIVGQQYYLPIFKKRAIDINQAVKDGNTHITPFMVLYDMNPSELKAYLGKRIWKVLCSNSITRNKLIVSSLRESTLYVDTQYRTLAIESNDFDYSTYNEALLKNRALERRVVDETCKIKSTLLKLQKKYFYKMMIDNSYCLAFADSDQVYFDISMYFTWVQSIKNLPLCTKEGNKYRLNSKISHEFLNLFQDTKKMAKNLSLPFNNEWSLKRMKSEHDRLAKITVLKKIECNNYDYLYDDEIMEILEIDFKEFNLPNIQSKLICSLHELAIEGAEMGHCVANYDNEIKNNSYLVFKLNDKSTGDRSTLGIFRNRNNCFNKDQHYGRFNFRVKNEELIEASNIIIEILNDNIGYESPGLVMAM